MYTERARSTGLGRVQTAAESGGYTKPFWDALAAGDCDFNYGAYTLMSQMPSPPPLCWLQNPAGTQFIQEICRRSPGLAEVLQVPANWAKFWRYSSGSDETGYHSVGDRQTLDDPATGSTLYVWSPSFGDFLTEAPPSMVAYWKAGGGGRGLPPQLALSPTGAVVSGPSLAEQEAAQQAFAAERDALAELLNRILPGTFGQWQNALAAAGVSSSDAVWAQIIQGLQTFREEIQARYDALLQSGRATGDPLPVVPSFPYNLVPTAPPVETLSPVAGAVPAPTGTAPPPSTATAPSAIAPGAVPPSTQPGPSAGGPSYAIPGGEYATPAMPADEVVPVQQAGIGKPLLIGAGILAVVLWFGTRRGGRPKGYRRY